VSRAARAAATAPIFGVAGSAPYTRGVGNALTTLAVSLVLLAGTPAWAGPTDQLREYTDQVVKVLDDPSMARQDRRAAVRKIAHEAFDISETAQRVLARHWQARTPAEREEFTQLFADLLERTYIARMDEYGGERIRYLGESIDGSFASVKARIVTRTGTEVAVESRMNLRGDRWLIYDILIENVSLVGNYRSQFDRIIRSSSYEELVRRLKTKREEFLNESTPRARRSAG
jgi:phospholipid transport system substrate-binding protein